MEDNIDFIITNHNIKSFNFEFILNTKLEGYYEELIDDEIIFSKKPTNEKIYIDCRVISEYIVKSVAMKLFEEDSNKSFNDNLEKLSGNIPEKIYKDLDHIRLNGNKYGHQGSKPYDVTVEQTFRAIHSCLLWYFKRMNLELDEIYDVDFIVPNHVITGKNEERYLNIIKQQRIKYQEMIGEDSNGQFSEYSTFYKAFVKLDGQQLRKIYVTLDKLSIATVLISSIKNKFRKSDIDEMQKLIDNEASKLELYSDEEIKFKIYYKLMKLSNISNGCLVSGEEFKGNLDKFVEFAYCTLEKKKDFKSGCNKLETINAYYMNKIIYDFQKKFNDTNEDIQKDLIDNIYNNFEKLPKDLKKQLYDKLNIKNPSADVVKVSMKTMGPTFMLSTLIDVGGFASYTTLSSIIFRFSHLLGVTFSFGVCTSVASLLSFLTGPYMIALLQADGSFAYGYGKKQKIDLVPMIIMQICVSEISLKNDNNCEEKYCDLVRIWKEKRNDFEINNNIKIKVLQEINELNENKSNLEKECSKETKVLEALSLKFQQEKESFKYTLLISPKRSSLKNYAEFHIYSSKLKTITYKSSTNRGLGFFSKIVSKVKDRTQEFIIKKKINELESILVLEGTQSELFNSETIKLKQIEKDLVEKNIAIINLKGKIEEESKKIIISKGKLTNVEIKMKNIKEEFFDIDNIS